MLYDKKWNQEVKVDEVGELLLKAADVVERKGWCQCRLRTPSGRVCVMGAVLVAHGEDIETPFYDHPYWLDKAMGRIQNVTNRWPPEWNDQGGRTAEEVVSVLRQAAYT